MDGNPHNEEENLFSLAAELGLLDLTDKLNYSTPFPQTTDLLPPEKSSPDKTVQQLT